MASGIASFMGQPRSPCFFHLGGRRHELHDATMISIGNALHTQPAQNMPLEGGADVVPELMTVSFAIRDAIYQLSRMI